MDARTKLALVKAALAAQGDDAVSVGKYMILTAVCRECMGDNLDLDDALAALEAEVAGLDVPTTTPTLRTGVTVSDFGQRWALYLGDEIVADVRGTTIAKGAVTARRIEAALTRATPPSVTGEGDSAHLESRLAEAMDRANAAEARVRQVERERAKQDSEMSCGHPHAHRIEVLAVRGDETTGTEDCIACCAHRAEDRVRDDNACNPPACTVCGTPYIVEGDRYRCPFPDCETGGESRVCVSFVRPWSAHFEEWFTTAMTVRSQRDEARARIAKLEAELRGMLAGVERMRQSGSTFTLDTHAANAATLLTARNGGGE